MCSWARDKGSTWFDWLVLDGKQAAYEERLLVALGQRIRIVRQGPEGAS